MIVMPSNNTGRRVLGWIAAGYEVAHLISPGGERRPRASYALDNGAYSAWLNGSLWDQEKFERLLRWSSGQLQGPLWVVAPDVVCDAKATVKMFPKWRSVLKRFSVAIAVQDGMTPRDVLPLSPDVVFVGGSTQFKWRSLVSWVTNFPRVHVARVNSPEKLWRCKKLGVESVDGTGWTRGDENQTLGLEYFLEKQKQNEPHPQTEMFYEHGD